MKYWILVNGEVPGSFEPHELAGVAGFSAASLVCPASGNPSSRNWQRAGLYPEIVDALRAGVTSENGSNGIGEAHAAESPPTPLSPSDVINSTGEKLFRHVTELMRELENRREEKALMQSLERALDQARGELESARARMRSLEERASLIDGFEDRERKLQEFLTRSKQDVVEKSAEVARLEREAEERRKRDHEAERDRAQLEADLGRARSMGEQLTKKLSERELALAKAMSVLQRLEQEMGQILPGAAEPAKDAASPRPKPPMPRVTDASAAGKTPLERDGVPTETRTPVEQPAPVAETLRPKVPLTEIPSTEFAPDAEPLAAATSEPSSPDAAPLATVTIDDGLPEAPVELPPEGVLTPITPPWVAAVKWILSSVFHIGSGEGPPARFGGGPPRKKMSLPKRP